MAEVVKAFSMHSVRASQEDTAFPRVLHTFKADHTVLLQPLVYTLMVVLKGDMQATVTRLTVKKVLSRADSAEITLRTVEYAKFNTFIIIQ